MKITSSSHLLFNANELELVDDEEMEGEGEAGKLRADARFRRGLKLERVKEEKKIREKVSF